MILIAGPKGSDRHDNAKIILKEHNNSLIDSHNIHLILVDNSDRDFKRIHQENIRYELNDRIRMKVSNVVYDLIEKYKGDHLVVIYYGYNIRMITPVINIEESIVGAISDIVWTLYDYSNNVTRDIMLDAFKSGFILSKPEFKFLIKYDKVYLHELL